MRSVSPLSHCNAQSHLPSRRSMIWKQSGRGCGETKWCGILSDNLFKYHVGVSSCSGRLAIALTTHDTVIEILTLNLVTIASGLCYFFV